MNCAGVVLIWFVCLIWGVRLLKTAPCVIFVRAQRRWAPTRSSATAANVHQRKMERGSILSSASETHCGLSLAPSVFVFLDATHSRQPVTLRHTTRDDPKDRPVTAVRGSKHTNKYSGNRTVLSIMQQLQVLKVMCAGVHRVKHTIKQNTAHSRTKCILLLLHLLLVIITASLSSAARLSLCGLSASAASCP